MFKLRASKKTNDAIKADKEQTIACEQAVIDPDVECEVLKRSGVYVVRHIKSGRYVAAEMLNPYRINIDESPRWLGKSTFFHSKDSVSFCCWLEDSKWDAHTCNNLSRMKQMATECEAFIKERKGGIMEAFVDEVRVWR